MKYLVAITLLAVVSAVNATNNTGPSNNNGPVTANGGAGGAGGAGGKGGSAMGVGVGVGIGGAAHAVNSLKNSGNSKSKSSSSSTGGAASVGSVTASPTITTKVPRQVPSAVAPSIMSTSDCPDASGAGLSTDRFSISFGKSKSDNLSDCNARANSTHVMYILQDAEVAEEIMCDSKSYRDARRRVGRPCSALKTPEETGYYGNDVVVMKRLEMVRQDD